MREVKVARILRAIYQRAGNYPEKELINFHRGAHESLADGHCVCTH